MKDNFSKAISALHMLTMNNESIIKKIGACECVYCGWSTNSEDDIKEIEFLDEGNNGTALCVQCSTDCVIPHHKSIIASLYEYYFSPQ